MRSCPKCGNAFPDKVKFCPTDGSALGPEAPQEQVDPLLGTLIDRYRLVDKLGEGGMGMVYKAEHTMIGRPVALKLLHPDLARVPQAVDRFFREARAANEVASEHIVQVTDFGKSDDGANFLVMEFLGGKSLQEELASQPAMSVQLAVHITSQIAEALEKSHEKGVVHRDLKPANVQLVERGTDPHFVKLLDFGIAKITESGTQLTKTGMILGSPAYMSPEQASGEKVDHRTDVYALGIILYEMLVGTPPFTGESPTQILLAHVSRKPIPPSSSQPGIPPELEQLIMSCLAKSPEERPANMSVVRGMLSGFQTRAGLGPAPGAAVGAAVGGMIPQTVRSDDPAALSAMGAQPGAALASTMAPPPAASPQGMVVPAQVAPPGPPAGNIQAQPTELATGMQAVAPAPTAVVADAAQNPALATGPGIPQAALADPATEHVAPLVPAQPQGAGNKTYLLLGIIGGVVATAALAVSLVYFLSGKSDAQQDMKAAKASVGMVTQDNADPGDGGVADSGAVAATDPKGEDGGAEASAEDRDDKVARAPITRKRNRRKTAAISTTPDPPPAVKAPPPRPRPTRPQVVIRSTPSGAEVYSTGGKLLGRTPRTYFSDKPFTVTLRKFGYKQATVSPRVGTRGTVRVRLVQPEFRRTQSARRLKELHSSGQITRFQRKMRLKVLAHERKRRIDQVHMNYKICQFSRSEKRRQINAIKDSYR